MHAAFDEIIGRNWEPPIVAPVMVAQLDFENPAVLDPVVYAISPYGQSRLAPGRNAIGVARYPLTPDHFCDPTRYLRSVFVVWTESLMR
jgi:hypothetical protein